MKDHLKAFREVGVIKAADQISTVVEQIEAGPFEGLEAGICMMALIEMLRTYRSAYPELADYFDHMEETYNRMMGEDPRPVTKAPNH